MVVDAGGKYAFTTFPFSALHIFFKAPSEPGKMSYLRKKTIYTTLAVKPV